MPLIWIAGCIICFVIPVHRRRNDHKSPGMGFDRGGIYAAVWSTAVAGFALGFVLTGTPEAMIAVVFPLIAAALLLVFAYAARNELI